MAVPGLSMRVSDDGQRVWAKWQPAVAGPDQASQAEFDVDLVRQALAELGLDGCVLDLTAIEQMRVVARSTDRSIERAIATRRDGAFVLTISEDLMEVRLTLERPRGGKAVTRADVEDGLLRAGVTAGVLTEEIDAAMALGVATGRVIARGQPQEDGADTEFELLVEESTERKPQVDEHGMFDIRNLGQIPGVIEGSPVMRRVPSRPGVNGFTVKGQVLKAKNGRPVPYASKLKGVVPDADDPDLLRAAITGRPVRVARGVHVEPAIDFPSVDMSTGHVDFDGSVTVLGDVQPLMKIRASGDVVVHGTVTAAEIHAGGQVVLLGGLKGAPKDEDEDDEDRSTSDEKPHHTGRVQCGGRFHAVFVEHAEVEAGDDVVVDDHVTFSDIKSGRHIVVGTSSGKGLVLGGTLTAVGQVNVGTLGSLAAVPTFVHVGLDETHRHDLEHLDREIAAYEADRTVSGELDLMRDQAEALRRKLTYADRAQVAVSRGTYPGTKIRIRNRRWVATDYVPLGVFRIYDDKVHLFRH